MKRVVSTTFCLAILTIASCEPPSTNYGTPIAPPISSYGTPNYQANGQDHGDHGGGGGGHDGHDYNGEPKAYEFGYQVKDEYTGTDYNRRESSDGNQVRGEYRVALPDGRLQIVTYWADWQSGFHADVRYEGEAQYPDQYNKAGGGYQQGGYPQGGAGVYSQGGGGYQQGGYQQQGNGGYNDGGGYSGGNDGYNYNSNNNNYNYNEGGYHQNSPSNTYGPV